MVDFSNDPVPTVALVGHVAHGDVRGFEQALRAVVQSDGFQGARQALARAAVAEGPQFALFSLRVLGEVVGTACRQAKPDPALVLLAELGPAAGCPSSSLEAMADSLRRISAAPPGLLSLAIKVLRAWGVKDLAAELDATTQEMLRTAVLAASRGSAALPAAGFLEAFPTILDDSGCTEVLAAVDDGSHDDVAERLVSKLSFPLQLSAVHRRKELGRLKSAARLVHAVGLESEFPGIDFAWRSQSLEGALKHGSSHAVVGLAFSEPGLRQRAVSGLQKLGYLELAVELGDAWGMALGAEARSEAVFERSQRDATHLLLPDAFQVAVVDSDAAVAAMREVLLQSSAVGMDVEWVPTAAVEQPALLQLANASAAYLVDLCALAASDALGGALQELFSARHITKVGFDGFRDLSRIAKNLPALGLSNQPTSFVDLPNLEVDVRVQSGAPSRKKAREGISLSSMSEKYLGNPLDKTLQMSDWSRRPLSEMQMRYAALDAWAPVQIYAVISAP